MPKSLLVVVLKHIARWGLRVGKMSCAPNFIFTVPQIFPLVMALMLALSKTVGSCILTQTSFNN